MLIMYVFYGTIYFNYYNSNYSTDWKELQRNLKEVLELSISGIPLVSVAACGTIVTTNDTEFLEELCTRWYQMAAYMPAMYSFYQGDDQPKQLPFS
jgi:alpha-glucosidase (family GH31 glycosyl hydrolase)